jgi:hypothetical protein
MPVNVQIHLGVLNAPWEELLESQICTIAGLFSLPPLSGGGAITLSGICRISELVTLLQPRRDDVTEVGFGRTIVRGIG